MSRALRGFIEATLEEDWATWHATTRRIFGDWLEDQGDGRAEAVRSADWRTRLDLGPQITLDHLEWRGDFAGALHVQQHDAPATPFLVQVKAAGASFFWQAAPGQSILCRGSLLLWQEEWPWMAAGEANIGLTILEYNDPIWVELWSSGQAQHREQCRIASFFPEAGFHRPDSHRTVSR